MGLLNDALKTVTDTRLAFARRGLPGVRAKLAATLYPQAFRPRSEGYGSGQYAGSYVQMAHLFKELRADPTGLALAAESSEIIYKCIQVRTNAITGLEWGIYPKAGKRDSNTKVENTSFHRLLDYAQTEFGQSLLYLWELSLAVHGEVFFEKLVRPDGLPGGAKYLNRLGITPYIMGGHVDYYTYSDDAGMINLRPHLLIRHGLTNLLDDFAGSSDVARALDSLNSDRGRAKHVLSYFRNGAKIGGWLTLRTGAQIDDAKYAKLKAEFKEHLAGPDNAYKWGMLPAELEAQSSQNQPFEHHAELEDSDVKRMHDAMQVSPVLTGSVAAGDPLSSMGTLEAAKAFFYESWVQARAKAIELVINQQFLPWLQMDSYEFAFDIDRVLATMRQTTERSGRVRAEYAEGLITFNQAQVQLGYDAVPGGDFYVMRPGVVVVQADQLSNVAALLPLPAPAMPFGAPPGMASVALPAAPVVDANKDATPAAPVGQPLHIGLTLANQPDLMQLQTRVKQLVGDSECRWNTPDDFHVTLVYAPAASDEQVAQVKAALEQLDVPELALHVGSLGVFDNVGEHAVHFKLRSPNDLKDFQQQVYDLCKQTGLATSAYSNPSGYTPHITMGYTVQNLKPIVFSSKLRVQPDALRLSSGDAVVWEKTCGAVDDEPEPPPGKSATVADLGSVEHVHGVDSEHDDTDAHLMESAQDELRAWERKVKNKGARKGAAFVCAVLPKDVEAFVRDSLQDEPDRDGVKALFAKAAAKLPSEFATPEEYDAYWQQYDALQKQIGNEWLMSYMSKVVESLNGKLNAELSDAEIAAALDAQAEGLVGEWVGTEAEPGVLTKLVLAGMAAGQVSLEKGGRNIDPSKLSAKFSLQIDWELMAKQAFDFAKQYAYQLIRGLSDTTRQLVRDTISQWVASGDSQGKLEDSLNEIFKDRVRAQRIAQTESTRVYAEGAQQRWAEAGVTQALWKTVNDELVCKICRGLRNVVGDFTNGWKSNYDGKMYKFPAHPGDRCFPKPIIE
jgi:2'-5' RNA ligase